MTRATENPSQPTPADHPPTPPAPVAATTTSGPATPPAPADRRAWAGLAVLCLVLLVVTMDTSILFFAAPHLAADLRPSATELLWIFDIYGFVLAGLLITMGSLADSLGRRRVLLGGATLYAVASLAAAYAPTAAALIAARALLGVGGATLMPSTLALVRTLFRDERQRALAVGIWSGVMSGGVGLGPVLAGVLLERYWWGSVFVVNLPVVALLLVLGPRLLPESRAPRSSVDLAGSALLLAGILPLVHVLKSATTQGWSPTGHLPWLAVGVGALTLFVRRESRVAAPMVDLSLLRRPAFPATLLLQVIAMFGVMGNAVLMTAYLQSVLGMSVLSAALWSLAASVGVGLAAPGSALLSRALGRPIVMALGAAGGRGVRGDAYDRQRLLPGSRPVGGRSRRRRHGRRRDPGDRLRRERGAGRPGRIGGGPRRDRGGAGRCRGHGGAGQRDVRPVRRPTPRRARPGESSRGGDRCRRPHHRRGHRGGGSAGGAGGAAAAGGPRGVRRGHARRRSRRGRDHVARRAGGPGAAQRSDAVSGFGCVQTRDG